MINQPFGILHNFLVKYLSLVRKFSHYFFFQCDKLLISFVEAGQILTAKRPRQKPQSTILITTTASDKSKLLSQNWLITGRTFT